VTVDFSSIRGLVIAGRSLNGSDALKKLAQYPERTPPRYDLPGPGDPDVLSPAEVARTRVIKSRISNRQAEWFVERAKSAPWMSAAADLRDADPAEPDGLYAAMAAMYDHFIQDRPEQVNHAKVSKVLHIKRPALFPILDDHVFRIYKQAAREQALRYPQLGYRRMTWAAIREDLVSATTTSALTQLRAAIDAHPAPHVNVLANLTDLRLLDILTW
jgi:hypothetical protein